MQFHISAIIKSNDYCKHMKISQLPYHLILVMTSKYDISCSLGVYKFVNVFKIFLQVKNKMETLSLKISPHITSFLAPIVKIQSSRGYGWGVNDLLCTRIMLTLRVLLGIFCWNLFGIQVKRSKSNFLRYRFHSKFEFFKLFNVISRCILLNFLRF